MKLLLIAMAVWGAVFFTLIATGQGAAPHRPTSVTIKLPWPPTAKGYETDGYGRIYYCDQWKTGVHIFEACRLDSKVGASMQGSRPGPGAA